MVPTTVGRAKKGIVRAKNVPISSGEEERYLRKSSIASAVVIAEESVSAAQSATEQTCCARLFSAGAGDADLRVADAVELGGAGRVSAEAHAHTRASTSPRSMAGDGRRGS